MEKEEEKKEEQSITERVSSQFMSDKGIANLLCKKCNRVPLIFVEKTPIENPLRESQDSQQNPLRNSQDSRRNPLFNSISTNLNTEVLPSEQSENLNEEHPPQEVPPEDKEVYEIPSDEQIEEKDKISLDNFVKFKYQVRVICQCSEGEQIYSFEDFFKKFAPEDTPAKKCENHSDKDASKYCLKCKKFYCVDCEKDHGKDDNQKEHILNYIEYNNNECCSKHNDNICDSFCDDCKIPICSACSYQGEHERHHITSDTEEMKNYLKPEVVDHIISEYIRADTLVTEENKTLKDKVVNKLKELTDLVEKTFDHYSTLNQNLLKIQKMVFKSYELCPTSIFAMTNLVNHSDYNLNSLGRNCVTKDSVVDCALRFSDYFKETEILKINKNSGKTNWIKLIKEEKVSESQGVKAILPLPNKKVAFACEDGKIKIYTFSKEEKKKQEESDDIIELVKDELFDGNIWKAHDDWVNYITLFNSDKEEILSCSKDGSIKVWKKTENGKYETNPEILIRYDGKYNEDSMEMEYNPNEPNEPKKKQNIVPNISKAIPLSKERIAACSWDHSIKIFDKAKNCIKSFEKEEGHNGIVNSILQLQNQEILVSSSDDMTIRFWDLNEYKQIGKIEGILNTNKESIHQYDEKTLLLSNCFTRELLIVDVGENSPSKFKVTSKIDMDNLFFNIHSIIKTNKDDLLICSGDGGILCKIDYEKKKVINVKWDSHPTFISCIGQVKDEAKVLCSADTYGLVRFWQF
ncbi:MAG: hypothetical protein MJ252_09170 [archaeon]|nr:hypothetical protein [archaeon]